MQTNPAVEQSKIIRLRWSIGPRVRGISPVGKDYGGKYLLKSQFLHQLVTISEPGTAFITG